MKIRINQVLSVLAATALAFPLATWAQEKADDDTKKTDSKEEQEARASVVDNEVEAGIYYLNDDSFRFGKYSGLTDQGAYALVDFRWEKRPAWNSGDATRWKFQGWRLGLDSRRLTFDLNQQGRQKLSIDYRQIPNNEFDNGLTPYMGLGGGELRMPVGWEVAPGNNKTSGFINLDQFLRPYDIRTERKSLALDYDLKISANWSLALDFRHEIKDGVRNTWAMIGEGMPSTRSVEVPAPVDWTTNNFNLMFNYANGRLQFGAGMYGSFFANDTTSLTWQNAFGKVGNWAPGVAFPDGFGLMALEPENSYLQFKTYGVFIFNAKTRLTADFSWGSMEQDDAFYPYTVNPALRVRTGLPLENADAKINTAYFNTRLTSRLSSRLNLVVSYLYDDRDNKTPQATYRYVRADSENQMPAVESRINLPYSYTRNKANALLNWTVARAVSVKGGVEWNDYSREYTEVEDSNELTWLAGVRWASLENLSASLDYRYSDRDVDEYVGNAPFQASHVPGVLPPDAWQNHPWQRKYYLTDRTRDELRLRVDWFPAESFNVGLTGLMLEDDYGSGNFGLNEAEANSWTLDFGYRPAEKVSLGAFYTREQWEASQSNRQIISFNPESAYWDEYDWWADTVDRVDTMNLNARFDGLGDGERFSFGFDYTLSNVKSRITVTGAEAIDALPLPQIKNQLTSVTVYGQFELNEHSSIRIRAENGKLEVDDFALDNVSQNTLPQVLTLGQPTQDYNLWLFSASWKYRF